MGREDLKERIVHGVIWRIVSRLSTQGVTFAVGIVLARLLGPEAYGTVAMLTIFVSISEALVNCGFNSAIIQKKSLSDVDLSSVFWLQFSLAWFFYAVLFFFAPYIARFYHNVALSPVLRVQALILPVNAVHGIQMAMVYKDLRFGISFAVGLVGSIFSAVVGLTLAFLGFGYWSLVWSTLSGGVATMCASCFLVRMRPHFLFSIASLKEMFSFGGKMLASDFIGQTIDNLTSMVIARVYSPKDLACYTRGKQLPSMVMDLINSSLTNVYFPAFSKLQDDLGRFRSAMRKGLQSSTFFVMPMMAGLSAVTDSVVNLLLGEKWLDSVPYATIICISSSLFPFATVNLQAIKGLGLGSCYLSLTILKSFVSLVVLCLFCRAGMLTLAIGFVAISSPLSMIINNWPVRKTIGYGIGQQICDVLPVVLMAIAMGLVVWSVRFVWHAPHIVFLPVQIVVGLLVYYCLLIVFRPKALFVIFDCLPIARKLFPKFVIE